jgi:hypothetical protein
MAADLPVKLLLITFAGFVNRDQSRLIAYLLEENRVYREHLGMKRVGLTDDQRRHLAVKGKPLARRLLDRIAMIVTPDTSLRWHRVSAITRRGGQRRTSPHAPMPHASARSTSWLLDRYVVRSGRRKLAIVGRRGQREVLHANRCPRERGGNRREQ